MRTFFHSYGFVPNLNYQPQSNLQFLELALIKCCSPTNGFNTNYRTGAVSNAFIIMIIWVLRRLYATKTTSKQPFS